MADQPGQNQAHLLINLYEKASTRTRLMNVLKSMKNSMCGRSTKPKLSSSYKLYPHKKGVKPDQLDMCIEDYEEFDVLQIIQVKTKFIFL